MKLLRKDYMFTALANRNVAIVAITAINVAGIVLITKFGSNVPVVSK